MQLAKAVFSPFEDHMNKFNSPIILQDDRLHEAALFGLYSLDDFLIHDSPETITP